MTKIPLALNTVRTIRRPFSTVVRLARNNPSSSLHDANPLRDFCGGFSIHAPQFVSCKKRFNPLHPYPFSSFCVRRAPGLTNPARPVTIRELHPCSKWACGAAGSALPWHGRGHRFDPDQVHQSFHYLNRASGHWQTAGVKGCVTTCNLAAIGKVLHHYALRFQANMAMPLLPRSPQGTQCRNGVDRETGSRTPCFLC